MHPTLQDSFIWRDVHCFALKTYTYQANEMFLFLGDFVLGKYDDSYEIRYCAHDHFRQRGSFQFAKGII